MSDIVTIAVSVGTAALTVVGVGIALGRLREKVDNQDEQIDRLADSVKELHDGQGGNEVSRADLLARLTQVERNTASVQSQGDRLTRLETSAEIHHKDVVDKIASLDRGQQGLNRMVANWISQQGGGKLMIMGSNERD